MKVIRKGLEGLKDTRVRVVIRDMFNYRILSNVRRF